MEAHRCGEPPATDLLAAVAELRAILVATADPETIK
jgi:hypothetical protein